MNQMAEVGFAVGKCPRCGKTLRRRRPADYAVCEGSSKSHPIEEVPLK